MLVLKSAFTNIRLKNQTSYATTCSYYSCLKWSFIILYLINDMLVPGNNKHFSRPKSVHFYACVFFYWTELRREFLGAPKYLYKTLLFLLFIRWLSSAAVFNKERDSSPSDQVTGGIYNEFEINLVEDAGSPA